MKYLTLIALTGLLTVRCSSDSRESILSGEQQTEGEKQEQFDYARFVDTAKGNSLLSQRYFDVLDLVDVDYQRLLIPTTCGEIHILLVGDQGKEPVVLLHGLNASSAMWYPNLSELSQNHRLICIDLPGEPNLSKPRVKVSENEDILDAYKEVLDSLKLDQPHFIGASRGGWMAINFALKYPNRVKKPESFEPCSDLFLDDTFAGYDCQY